MEGVAEEKASSVAEASPDASGSASVANEAAPTDSSLIPHSISVTDVVTPIVNDTNETVNNELPIVNESTTPSSNSLILSGKRNRRKVDMSADYLVTPEPPSTTTLINTTPGGSIKRRRSSKRVSRTDSTTFSAEASNIVESTADTQIPLPADIVQRRERLMQRRAELEAYLKRLQTALTTERKRLNFSCKEVAEIAEKKTLSRRRSFTSNKSSTKNSGGGGGSSSSSVVRARARETSHVAATGTTTDIITSSSSTLKERNDALNINTSKTCVRVLDDLVQNQFGHIFKDPVDWRTMNLPTYPAVVKRPMDLGLVRRNLDNGVYASMNAFAEDVQRIWDNAKLFNAPKSFVHDATLEMERIWSRKLANIVREQRRATKGPSSADNDVCVDAASFACATHTPSSSSAAAATAASAAAVERVRATKHEKQLTFQEKTKLRADIMKVSPDHVDRIAAITREGSGLDASDSTEIEIDIEKLNTATLRCLQRFLASVVPASTRSRASRANVSGVLLHKKRTRATPLSTSTGEAAAAEQPVPMFDSESEAESDSDSSSSSGLVSDSSSEGAAAVTGGATDNTNARQQPHVADVTATSVSQQRVATPASALAPSPAFETSSTGVGVANSPSLMTTVSAAVTDEPAEDVQIENSDAWSALDKKLPDEDTNDSEGAPAARSALWNNFQNDAAQKSQREAERRQEEQKRFEQAEQLKAQQNALDDKRRLEAEADCLRRKTAAEETERARLRKLEDEREAARQARETHVDDNEVDQAGAMGEFEDFMKD